MWLRLPKRGAGFPALAKADAIGAAFCHGWIDGQLDRYDETSWPIRFTPRRPRSRWSQVNRTRATVPDALRAALDASPAAAAFFATLTGANRYAILHRIGMVKRADTRARKIAGFVTMLERGATVHG